MTGCTVKEAKQAAASTIILTAAATVTTLPDSVPVTPISSTVTSTTAVDAFAVIVAVTPVSSIVTFVPPLSVPVTLRRISHILNSIPKSGPPALSKNPSNSTRVGSWVGVKVTWLVVLGIGLSSIAVLSKAIQFEPFVV